MSHDMPVVSIVMSMRNAAATIDLALRSILAQTFTNWELVLLDDGSSDNSLARVRLFDDTRIRLHADGRSLGLAERLRQGVENSRGHYVARMDADDVMYPNRLAKQATFLDAHPEVDLVGCGSLVFGNDGGVRGRLPVSTTHEAICAAPWSGFPLPHPSWMGRKEWFARHPYDSACLKAQDYDVLLRAHETSQFACLPEILLGYRQDRVSIKKSLLSRWHVMRSQGRFGASRQRCVFVCRGWCLQLGKAVMDAIALGSGLHGLIQRVRIQPLPDNELTRWHKMWAQLNQEIQ